MFRVPGGELLFLKRSATGDHAGEWAFPGGGIEGDETAAQAAKREAEEELGKDVAPRGDAFEAHQHEHDGVDFTTFEHPIPKPFAPELNEEHVAHAWARPEHAPEPLHPGARKVLAELAAQDADRFAYGMGGLEVVHVGTEPAPDPSDFIDESETGKPLVELEVTA